MTVTSTALALGSWAVKLKPGTPQDILDKLRYLGHVAISTGRPDPRVSGDSLLSSARYVGPLRKLTYSGDGIDLSGSGMMYWLGDENKKGPIIKAQLLFTGASFTSAFSQCLAATNSLRAGTIHSVTGGYTGYHQFVTIREAVTFICSTMTSDVLDPVEFRVNGDGTVDAGNASQLYNFVPKTAIVRRHEGADMGVRALPGRAAVDEDVEDYATEVILLGQGEGLGIASANVELPAATIPYKDLFGNTVRITRTVSQASTNAANSLVQAQIALNQYANPRDAVTLSTDQFDIEGDVRVGDSVWVHDPDAGLVDTSPAPHELIFRGERINPVRLRINELTWPVQAGMSVAYRDPDGNWIDLTDYVVWETGATSVSVGGYDRSLINPTGRQEALGSRAAPNTSIPAAPAFLLPFVQAVYQSASSGVTRAQVQIRWLRPLNDDGTDILDGDHYEIRYRTSDGPESRRDIDDGVDVTVYPGDTVYPGSGTYPGVGSVGGSAAVLPPGSPSTWAQVAGGTWEQMTTWAQPIVYLAGPWTTEYASFDTNQHLVQELTPGMPYQFQIRAVDNGVPPNYSTWSDPVVVVTNGDTIPPPTPAAPSVAASMIAVQVTHLLGAASGGTFNLPADMHHLEVHAEYEPTFTCSGSTLLGKLSANNGMIVSQTPVVGTLAVQSTAAIYVKVIAVDEAGNRSNPSTAVQSTATLIDDEHISNLTVSKVTAGTVSANWLMAAEISTAPEGGARAGMDAFGLFAYNAVNSRCWEVQDRTGDMLFYNPSGTPTMRCEAATGNVYLYKADGRTPAMTLTASAGLLDMFGKLTAGDGVGVGPTIVVDPTSGSPAINFYPGDSLDRFSMGVSAATRPDGTEGAVLALQSLDGATGNPEGFGINAWADNVWLGQRDATGWRSLLAMQGNGLVHLAGGPSTGFNPRPNVHLDSTGAYLEAPGQSVVVRTGDLNYLLITPTSATLVSGGTVKAFTIDHPTDPDRWLVHGCTESPTAGVEYTGHAWVTGRAMVALPDYFEALTLDEGRTVQLTQVDTGGGFTHLAAGAIVDGQFSIRASAAEPVKVAWHVRATRRGADFDPEPRRDEITVHRVGPYSWSDPIPTTAPPED